MSGLLLVTGAAWLVVALLHLFGIREPRTLPDVSAETFPSVLIVVPARDEARGVVQCLSSLAGQRYPDFRVVVVDDRSDDGTGRLARGVSRGNARSVEVRDGRPLPDGWFGKPWACWQGVSDAAEDLILFTDADTWHAPDLLARSVAAMREDGAHAVSLLGDQTLGSFGERLVQPQVFALLGLRFRDPDRLAHGGAARDAIANGQYILIDARAYHAIGGHEAVRHEVVEDLRLAQRLTAAGFRLSLRGARGSFATRMYHSLREVIDGWTKNLATGARQAAGAWGPLALAGIVGFVTLFWIAPPLVLAWSVGRDADVARAAGLATGMGLLVWTVIYRRFDVFPGYALLYPLGAAVVAFIAVRSGLRGQRRIEWKGRRYVGGRVEGDGREATEDARGR